MLWNCRQALIQNEFENEVVGVDREAMSLEVWAPVVSWLDQTNGFPLICSELQVAWRERKSS